MKKFLFMSIMLLWAHSAYAGQNFPITNAAANSGITVRAAINASLAELAGVPYIAQGTSSPTLTGAQFLGNLATGLVKNTTTTGVLSIAVAGTDYLTPTGNGSGLTGITGKQINIQYLTSGTTYTPTAGTTSIVIELIAGGGGGGGVSGAASNAAAGGGGGAGGYLLKRITGVSGTGTYAIGAGGTAGANTGGTGGTGGNTTFTYAGTTYTAYGGVGGVGQTYGTAAAFVAGGAGGAVSANGDANGAGTGGEYGQRVSGTLAVSGGGAGTVYGGGGAGKTAQGAGNNAAGYGAGGGSALSTGTAYTGGTGAPGIIIVREFS